MSKHEMRSLMSMIDYSVSQDPNDFIMKELKYKFVAFTKQSLVGIDFDYGKISRLIRRLIERSLFVNNCKTKTYVD